jgi:hypothetical protein
MFPRSSRTGFQPVGFHVILAGVLPLAPRREGNVMAPKIEVTKNDEKTFTVRVTESGTTTAHQVTANPKYCAKVAGEKVRPEELICKSFEFLLEREPKESILGCFDLSVISRYFPEYESEIKKRL